VTSIHIRPVQDKDIDNVVELCALHAAYEESEYDRAGKASKLRHAIFTSNPSLFCFVAEQDGNIVGYSTATKEFSTWDAEYFLHMDCLYLLESTRGAGLGSLLIKKLKEFAVLHSCTHIQWQTPVDNVSGIKFYEKQGAVSKDKKRFYLDL
jgi:ribosomal protein S18 acetylase RimI-like enzyme